MLQLRNSSPFAPALSVLPNPEGIDCLYVVVKGTFSLLPRIELADAAQAPTLADEYRGDPSESSLKECSELHVGKGGTDVVLLGSAWSASGRPATEAAVSVRVSERRKIVRVIGDRVWKSFGRCSEPAPFERMPLVYERAFGGQHRDDHARAHSCEERNPAGVGFLGQRPAEDLVGKALPNLEDPQYPLERLGAVVPPACFAFSAPSWLPRRKYAGTYDAAWQRHRAPYLPRDFDRRFFNAAPPELSFERFLSGGERVEVLGASPDGPLRFELPRCRPKATVSIRGSLERPPFVLETVRIEPDEGRLCLTWRAELPCDKSVLKIEAVQIEGEGCEPLRTAAAW